MRNDPECESYLYFCIVEYLNELNEEQRVAVEKTEGPVMVLAGAGSGKTRVLTYRIAHLINKGISPHNILSLTFTNKAAREMKDRIAKIAGESAAKSLWMGTFHSVFAKILRIESEKLGYPSNFTIYDSDDSKRLIKEIIKGLNFDDKVYKPKLVLNRISGAKNNLLTPKAYQENAIIQKEDAQSKKPYLGKIYEVYNNRLFKAGAMDFDDLLFKTNILLRDFPEVLYKYQERFKYVMVDEYQDTNFSQYVIVKALASRHENICVVGDDAQSIYSFRGANIQNILNFQKDYSDAEVFKLEQNYRSTKNIVEAANSLINKNKEQFKKNVWTSNTSGNPIKLTQAFSDNEEGLNVAHEIYGKHSNEGIPYSKFAILYRTNAQSRAMEDGLRKLNLPYQIYGGLSFYQRKEIKDLLAYFRLIINPKDEDALKRIINYPKRGIGKTTIDKLSLYSNESDTSLWEIVENIDASPVSIAGATKNKIRQFAELIKQFKVIIEKNDAFDAGTIIAKSTGILKDLNNDKSAEGVARYENVQELLNSMKDFTVDDDREDKSLAAFILDIPLLTDQDEKKTDDDEDKITLMTIHASKGLEFPYVFIVGLEENLFPSQMSVNSASDLEEERRLFYVALTRAETQCYISFARSRYKWGDLLSCEPSRFIAEIDPEFVDASGLQSSTQTTKDPFETNWDPGSANNSGSFGSQHQPTQPPKKFVRVPPQAGDNTVTGDDTSNLKAGDKVQHGRFGKGEVAEITGSDNDKAIIDFEIHGRKQLLLKFAKLKILA